MVQEGRAQRYIIKNSTAVSFAEQFNIPKTDMWYVTGIAGFEKTCSPATCFFPSYPGIKYHLQPGEHIILDNSFSKEPLYGC